MKNIFLSIILTFSINLVYSQTYKVTLVSGELKQKINNNWEILEFDQILTSNSFKLYGDNSYVIISNEKLELRKIDVSSFDNKYIDDIFRKDDSFSKAYISYLYKQILKKKKKEENIAIGAVYRKSIKSIYPINGSVVNDLSILSWDSDKKTKFYVQLLFNKELLIDTLINSNKLNISNISRIYGEYLWYVSDEYFDLKELISTKGNYSFVLKELHYDNELYKNINEPTFTSDEEEQNYFLSIYYESIGNYDLAIDFLSKIVENNSEKQYLIDEFHKRRKQ